MPRQVQLLIITGLSGAGKTVAVQSLEDLGYFCVDNLPPVLIPKFAEVLQQSGGKVGRAALVIDLRGGAFFPALFEALSDLDTLENIRYQILFLDADDVTLVRRYKETRRRHPLAGAGSPIEGIAQERKQLQDLKERADYVLNTSTLKPRELKEELRRLFADTEESSLSVNLVSFGFKYGVPIDADLVFDVRFLPNPYYQETLRPLTGREEPVYRYVMGAPQTQEFLQRLEEFLLYLLPHYQQEGKSQLVIGIGCTGGKHRSVAIAEHLKEALRKNHYDAKVHHRDIGKDHS